MPSKAWVGIDPGKKGAVAVVRSDWDVVAFHTPTDTTRVKRKRKKTPSGKPSYSSKTEYNLPAMHQMLLEVSRLLTSGSHEVSVTIEHQAARPRDGKGQVFQTGRGMGLWEMACTANGLRYTIVTPAVWKAKYLPKGANKNQSILACQGIYPGFPLPKVKDEALAEAILIADYSMRLDENLLFPKPLQ